MSPYLEGHGLFPAANSGLLDPDPLQQSVQKGGSGAPQQAVDSVSLVLLDQQPCLVSEGQCHLHSLQIRKGLIFLPSSSFDRPFYEAETVLH